jgi:hypothetical protein
MTTYSDVHLMIGDGIPLDFARVTAFRDQQPTMLVLTLNGTYHPKDHTEVTISGTPGQLLDLLAYLRKLVERECLNETLTPAAEFAS